MNSRASFHLRLLLALLLAFGSEVLAWSNPTGRPALEWLLVAPGYLAMSAILLDFVVRYRVRDLFGALLLVGLYALTAALVINPALMLNDMPRTLVTRVMGAHGLIAAEMFGLFLALMGGDNPRARRYLLIGAVIVALAWGLWVKGWPPEEGFGEVSLAILLAYGIGGAGLITLFRIFPLSVVSYVFNRGARLCAPPVRPESSAESLGIEALRLSRTGWGVVTLVLGTLFIIRLAQGVIDGSALILIPLLMLLCWGIVWFRGRKTGETLLDAHIPPETLPLAAWSATVAVFLAVAVFAYNLPPIQVGEVTPVKFIGLGFTAYGLAWLPTVSLVLGLQSYLRQIQTRRL
jgi:hypothetical protein